MGNKKKASAITLIEACHGLVHRTWPTFSYNVSKSVGKKVEAIFKSKSSSAATSCNDYKADEAFSDDEEDDRTKAAPQSTATTAEKAALQSVSSFVNHTRLISICLAVCYQGVSHHSYTRGSAPSHESNIWHVLSVIFAAHIGSFLSNGIELCLGMRCNASYDMSCTLGPVEFVCVCGKGGTFINVHVMVCNSIRP